MIAIIYRAYLQPGCEEKYCLLWQMIANHFAQHCGALGSSLHKTADDLWVAYSRWPDLETRDRVWIDDAADLPENIKRAIKELKACLDEKRPFREIHMEVVKDIGSNL